MVEGPKSNDKVLLGSTVTRLRLSVVLDVSTVAV